MITTSSLVMIKKGRTGLLADAPGIVFFHNPDDPRPWLVQTIEPGQNLVGKRYWCKDDDLISHHIPDPPSWSLPDMTPEQRAAAIAQNTPLLHMAISDRKYLTLAIVEAIEAALRERQGIEP